MLVAAMPTTQALAPSSPSLAYYAKRGHKRVQGWLHPFSAQYIAKLAELQRQAGIKGAAAEIGVHHGRLFILLHLAGSGEKDLAIDVFSDQQLNLDRSGNGNLERFLQNVRQFGGKPEAIEILQKSSLDVSVADIRARVQPVTLFSVDGGHTAQCALNDLKLADGALHEAGVVILDDFFNEAWPEVCLGAIDYLRDPASRLRPFAITPNKLYLCARAHNAFYRTQLQKSFHWRAHDKDVAMFGATVSVMGAARRDLHMRLRHWIADSPVGPPLKKLLRRGTDGAKGR